MEAICAQELERLQSCVAAAREMAARGDIRRGYSLLLRGFFQAERAASQQWSPQLFSCWRAAIDAYCEEFDPQHDEEPASVTSSDKRTGL